MSAILTRPDSENRWIPLAQAAAAAGATVRDINRVIDEHLLPDDMILSKPSRSLSVWGCMLARFYFASSAALTKEERLATIGQIAEALKGAPGLVPNLLVRHGFISIDLGMFQAETMKELDLMISAEEQIHSDPEILGGEPVFKGTRIPVYAVVASLAAGEDATTLRRAYPALDDDKLAAAKAYVDSHPRRGRPPARVRPQDGTVVSTRRVTLTRPC